MLKVSVNEGVSVLLVCFDDIRGTHSSQKAIICSLHQYSKARFSLAFERVVE